MKIDGSQHGDCCQGVCLPLPALTQSALLLLVILAEDSLGPLASQAFCPSLVRPWLPVWIFCKPSRVYEQLKELHQPPLQTSPSLLAVMMPHLRWRNYYKGCNIFQETVIPLPRLCTPEKPTIVPNHSTTRHFPGKALDSGWIIECFCHFLLYKVQILKCAIILV